VSAACQACLRLAAGVSWEPEVVEISEESTMDSCLGTGRALTEEVELPGGIIRHRVEYDVAPGDRVPAYHLFRRGLPADALGLLSIHAHGGSTIFPVGKAYHCQPKADDPSQYSYRAALAGFRVLAPDALLFGERQTPWGGNYYNEVAAHAELCGRGFSLAWKSVWDNERLPLAGRALAGSSVSPD